jgi:hypothetical protein
MATPLGSIPPEGHPGGYRHPPQGGASPTARGTAMHSELTISPPQRRFHIYNRTIIE